MYTEKRNRRITFICYGSYFLILLLTYGLLLQNHYSKDMYVAFANDANANTVNWQVLFSLGRIVPPVLKQIMVFLHLTPTVPWVQSLLFFLLSWLSMCILLSACMNCFDTLTRTEVATIFVIVSLAFINPFYLELFLFPESYCMFGAAVLFSVCAIYESSKGLSIKRCLLTLLFSVLAINSYQASLGICFPAMLALTLIRNQCRGNIKTIKNLLCIFSITFVAALSNLLTMSLANTVYVNSRGPSFTIDTILHNIQSIVQVQGPIAESVLNLSPKGPFSIFIAFLLFLFIIVAVQKLVNNHLSHLFLT